MTPEDRLARLEEDLDLGRLTLAEESVFLLNQLRSARNGKVALEERVQVLERRIQDWLWELGQFLVEMDINTD